MNLINLSNFLKPKNLFYFTSGSCSNSTNPLTKSGKKNWQEKNGNLYPTIKDSRL